MSSCSPLRDKVMHRRETSEYADIAAELSDEDLRGMYRDLGPHPTHRSEANGPPASGELGIWVSLLGQEAPDRLRAGPRPRTTPSPPTASTASPGAGASTRSTCSGSSGVTPRGLGPEREELPPLHHRHRRAGAARDRLCDGVKRDGAVAAGDPTATPPSSPSSATARPARATSTSPSSSPRSTTPRSSSSARTTSGRSPSRTTGRPASRSTSGPEAGFPGLRVDGNDVLRHMP